MSKLNVKTKSLPEPSVDTPAQTYEGGTATPYDNKAQLFLLASSGFFGEGSFYEGTKVRDDRLKSLSEEVACADTEWFTKFVKWLRHDGNIRTSAIVSAVSGAVALSQAGIPGGRQIVDSVLVRADEPGEALSYVKKTYGRVPKPVKRGIADAVKRLYTQKNLLKYDSKSANFSFGDVINLTHPKPSSPEQTDLFRYATIRNISGVEIPETLTTLTNRSERPTLQDILTNPNVLKDTGLTWEAVSSITDEGMTDRVWEAVIPQMGYMARLRNLRNFRQSGVNPDVYKTVLEQLSNPDEVRRSRQLPMRFLSAYQANSDHLPTAVALEKALNHSLESTPALSGKTLVLADRSGSMFWNVSQYSQLTYADSAALFGSALAVRGENVQLVEYGTGSREVKFQKNDSILPLIRKFHELGGTYLSAALHQWYQDHDRVIVITDEQDVSSRYYEKIPKNVPVYTFNLVGYQNSSNRGRTTIGGGLTDASFSLIEQLENVSKNVWPWS